MAKGLITDEQLQDALGEQRITKEFLGQILLKRRLITEKDFLETLSEQFGFPCARLNKKALDINIAMQFSATLILDHKCFPIKQDDYTVTVAITNPLDAWVLNTVEKEAKLRKPEFVLVSEQDMQWLIQQYRRYANIKTEQMFE